MEFAPVKLVLRCYAKKEQGKWQAFCLDLCLAAQADTFEEAKVKLKGMIASYVYDAVAGADREHASYLLSRRAPLIYRLKYHTYVALRTIGALQNSVRRAFLEVIPLVPPFQQA
jgi:hypothetical protein